MRFGDIDFPDITEQQRVEIQAKTDASIEQAWMNQVTELVDVEVLWAYREFDRHINNTTTAQLLAKLTQNIIENGVMEPIMLEYNPHSGLCKIGEGNHRLVVLKALGIQRVPAYAVRSQYMERSKDLSRMAKTIFPKVLLPRVQRCNDKPFDYIYPSYFKPSTILPEIAKGKKYAWTGPRQDYEELTPQREYAIAMDIQHIHDEAEHIRRLSASEINESM